MQLREGAIIPGTAQPVGEGVNRPVRAVLRVDGQALRAVVKALPVEGVTAEC